MSSIQSVGRFLARPIKGRADSKVGNRFHKLYYSSNQTWKNTRFLGVHVFKNPMDLWIYQEMLFELRPDLVVETGTSHGGSALYIAMLCDIIGNGRILSIDIEHRRRLPEHPRATYLLGSSIDPEVVAQVRSVAKEAESVMVILDSDHRRDHVLQELRLYSPMVTPGGYIVVEDTNVNGHPVFKNFGPGPMEAVDAFLAEDPSFIIDGSREKFLFTFNPRGFLKRII